MNYIIQVLTSISITIFNGFVISKLWGWFIVGTFTFMPLTLPAAIGISILMGFLTKQYVKQEVSAVESSMFHFLFALSSLIAGYVVQFFL